MPISFIKISPRFQLPSSQYRIFGQKFLAGNGRLGYFLARAENGGQIVRIAVNPKLCPEQNLEFVRGTFLDAMLNTIMNKRVAADASQPPFFLLDLDFSKIAGKVQVARTFHFDGHLFSDLLIEGKRDNLTHVAFFTPRRRHQQGLTLVGKRVWISPSSLVAEINGRKKIWDGTNF